jgi:hypothetical protein
MQADIGLRMRARKGRDLGKSRTRHHRAPRIYQSGFMPADKGRVDTRGEPKIVSMHDQQARIGVMT